MSRASSKHPVFAVVAKYPGLPAFARDAREVIFRCRPFWRGYLFCCLYPADKSAMAEILVLDLCARRLAAAHRRFFCAARVRGGLGLLASPMVASRRRFSLHPLLSALLFRADPLLLLGGFPPRFQYLILQTSPIFPLQIHCRLREGGRARLIFRPRLPYEAAAVLAGLGLNWPSAACRPRAITGSPIRKATRKRAITWRRGSDVGRQPFRRDLAQIWIWTYGGIGRRRWRSRRTCSRPAPGTGRKYSLP